LYRNIYSISLDRQPYRRAAQIGALEVMGYPVDTKLEFLSAYDYHAYKNEEFIDIAIEKGYRIYEKVRDFPEDSDFKRYDGCILLSHLLGLERIVEDDKVGLVLEDDAYFKVRHEELALYLKNLWNVVPKDDEPEIVMLSCNPDLSIHPQREVVPGTAGYFVKGALANGFVATVFSPTGAARVLDYHKKPENQIHSMECCLQIPFGDLVYSVSQPQRFVAVSCLQGGSVQAFYEATSGDRTDAYLGFARTLELNAAKLRKFKLAR